MTEHLNKARNAWGDDLPDWVEALATACDQTSQRRTAERIGYSSATVSLVLKATYSGDLTAVERAVNARILDAHVECPIAGDIPLADCISNQKPATRFTNQRQIQFLRTCPTCPQRGGK
ncbi:MAG: transcriptional regulator [Rhodospirillales bacterium]